VTETTAAGSEETVTRAVEEQAFYHEAALNAGWTGSRLAIGGLSFLFGAFAFAYFYLQSANSHQMWLPSSTTPPHQWYGATIMGLVVLSAIVQTAGLQQIKAGRKAPWMRSRSIPAISFVEQPPTYSEAFNVQRFQASLSSFTVVWNYLAVVTFIFWVLFYLR
jgi:hypothetical protein